MKDIIEIENVVKERLSEKRFNHSKSVEYNCEKLANIYGENIEKAKLIGIVHDIAKEIPRNEKIEYCINNNIQIDEIEKKSPELLHAKIGADIAKKEFGFDESMCKAIEYHTTGKVGMERLAKILFVADSIAEDRVWEGIEEGRKIAFEDLDKAVLYFLNHTIEYMLKKNQCIHPDSIFLRNEYLDN